jgi:hypothetical protein
MTMPQTDQNRVADVGGVWGYRGVRIALEFDQDLCDMWVEKEGSKGWFGGRCQAAKCPMCLFRTIGAGREWSRLPAHGFAFIGWRDCIGIKGVGKSVKAPSAGG